MKPVFSTVISYLYPLRMVLYSVWLLVLFALNSVTAMQVEPDELEVEIELLESQLAEEHERELEELEREQEELERQQEEELEEELQREQEEELDEEAQEEFDQFMAQKIQESSEELLDVVFDELQFQDQHGQAIWGKEWKVLVSEQAMQELVQLGYVFSEVKPLPAFKRVMANIKAPASFDFQQDYQQLQQTLKGKNAIVDRNHIYSSSAAEITLEAGLLPTSLLRLPSKGKGLLIGMLDTDIDTELGAFEHSNIVRQSFTPNGFEQPQQHGTQIASLFSANSHNYQGLIPEAKLFAASVFFRTSEQRDISSAEALIQGLNWLLENKVPVVNMSLSGPPNRLLEFAIQQMCEQGISVIAAAGNQGPLSAPLYPAAYPCTLAVTAVDKAHNIYPMAVQGEHISLAAVGVDVSVIDKDGHIVKASGTSIAAPFVSALVALHRSEANWLPGLLASCVDLGPRGKDAVFGHGLIQAKSYNSNLAAINAADNQQIQH